MAECPHFSVKRYERSALSVAIKNSLFRMCVRTRVLCVRVHAYRQTHAQAFDFLGNSKGNCWPRVRHLSEALNLYGHFPLHAAATVIICQQQFAKLHGSLSNPVIYYSKLHLDGTGMQRTWQKFQEVCHHRDDHMHRIKQNKNVHFVSLLKMSAFLFVFGVALLETHFKCCLLALFFYFFCM